MGATRIDFAMGQYVHICAQKPREIDDRRRSLKPSTATELRGPFLFHVSVFDFMPSSPTPAAVPCRTNKRRQVISCYKTFLSTLDWTHANRIVFASLVAFSVLINACFFRIVTYYE